jgi:hypothetical protein
MPLAPAPPHALPSPGAHLAPHRMLLPSTRQRASAFNQPLSLDTSKVTTMQSMFYVRSARALQPLSLESGLPRACLLRRRRPTPFGLPACTSPRIACPSFQLGSSQTPCRTRTGCSSVARGRAVPSLSIDTLIYFRILGATLAHARPRFCRNRPRRRQAH